MKDEEKTRGQLIVELESLRLELAESKKAESECQWIGKALRESEERYRRLLESITDYIYTVKIENGQSVSTTHGPGCLAVTGYISEYFQMYPHLWYEMIHEEDRKAVCDQAEKLLKGVEVRPLEHRIIHKDGSIRWVRNTPVSHFDKDGSLVSYDGIIEDITDRKAAAEVLKESEHKFKTLAERLPNMVFINKRGRIVYANARCEELMKYKREEFYSSDFNFLSLIAPEYLELVNAKLNKHMRGEEVEPYEYAIIARDGRRIEGILNTILIDYEGEKAILGIITDITERREMEEALRESEEKFKTIADSAPDGIVMMDGEANISYWNPAAERMFGYSKEEAIGKRLHEMIVPAGRHTGFSKGFERFQETGKGPVIGKTLELVGIRKDGTEFYAEHSISAVKVKGKWNAIGIVRDVSDRKKAEEALRASQEYARSIIESSMDMIIAVDKDRRITEFNRAAQETFGYSLEEVLGKHVDMLYADPSEGLKVHEVTLENGRHLQEIVNRHKNGELFPSLLSSSVLSNAQGDIIGVMGVSHDITRRKRDEDVLKEAFTRIERAKKEWEATFDSITDPLFIHDKAMRIVRANNAYADAAGIEFKEIVGRPYYEVFPKMDGPFKMCLEAKEMQEEEEYSCPLTNRIFKVRFYTIKDMNGEYLYSIHILEDITEAKKAAERLKEEMEVTSHLLMIAEATAHTINIENLMEHVVHCCHKIVKCDICLSYLWDGETRGFRPTQAFGLSNKLIPLFKTESLDMKVGIVKEAIKKKAPVVTEVGARHALPLQWIEDIHTFAIIPLMGKKGPLGLIVGIYSALRTPHSEFTDRDMKVMEGIMHQVSTALEEARLYNESIDRGMDLSHKINTIQAMQEIDRAVLSTLNGEEILETVTRMVARLVPCDRATVAIVNRERGGFVYTAGFGADFLSKGSVVPFGDTSATEGIETGRPDYVNNLAEVKDLLPLEKKFLEGGFLSHIRVPLMVKGEIVGVLSIGAKRPSAFTREDLSTLEKMAYQIGVALSNARLISDLEELFLGTVKSLSSAIDAKSPWTAGHSERVTKYALDIAKEMGLDREEVKSLKLAGLLHDIGKIGTYDFLLDKPGKLEPDEIEIVRRHPGKGAEILEPIGRFGNIIPAIKHHHEFYDGTGYPDRLKGNEIPLLARILSVADTYDAMGADRPYRNGRAMEVVVAELKRCSGTQFDPKVVDAFLKVIGGKEGIKMAAG